MGLIVILGWLVGLKGHRCEIDVVGILHWFRQLALFRMEI